MDLKGQTYPQSQRVLVDLDLHHHSVYAPDSRTEVVTATENEFGRRRLGLEACAFQQVLRAKSLFRWHEQVEVRHRAKPGISIHAVDEQRPLENGGEDVSSFKQVKNLTEDPKASLACLPMTRVNGEKPSSNRTRYARKRRLEMVVHEWA